MKHYVIIIYVYILRKVHIILTVWVGLDERVTYDVVKEDVTAEDSDIGDMGESMSHG